MTGAPPLKSARRAAARRRRWRSSLARQEAGRRQAQGQGRAKDVLSAGTFGGLELREIGPALTSGRVVDFAVDPSNHAVRYVAVGSGGVWKTTNAGTTWTPVFDDQGSYSIGCVALDPKNPLRRLGRHRREQQPAQRRLRRRRLQVRSTAARPGRTSGLEELRAHRQDPHRPARLATSSTSPPGAALGGRRRPRALQDHRRRQDLEARCSTISENTGVTDVVHGPAQPRRALRRGLPAPPPRLDADRRRPGVRRSTSRPTAARPGRKLESGLPERRPGPHRPRGRRRPTPTWSTPSSRPADKKGGIFRSTDGGETWEKRSDYVSTQPAVLPGDRRRPEARSTASTPWTSSSR